MTSMEFCIVISYRYQYYIDKSNIILSKILTAYNRKARRKVLINNNIINILKIVKLFLILKLNNKMCINYNTMFKNMYQQ